MTEEELEEIKDRWNRRQPSLALCYDDIDALLREIDWLNKMIDVACEQAHYSECVTDIMEFRAVTRKWLKEQASDAAAYDAE